MDKVSTATGEFHVEIDGPECAPWLVLSNSLGAALDLWQPQLEAFASHFRVLRYDTRGHGRSCVPAAPYSIEQLGSDVLHLLDVLKVEQANFCGLSMGGTVGIWLGAHSPERIKRLVLCNTTAWFGPPNVMNARIDAVHRGGMAAVADAVIERWFTPAFRATEPATVRKIRQAILATPVEGYVGCCAALRDLDERGSLGRIPVPTLVIGGEHDPAPTPDAARALADAIPGAQYVQLPAAHLSNVGAAEEFNASVLQFLEEVRIADSG